MEKVPVTNRSLFPLSRGNHSKTCDASMLRFSIWMPQVQYNLANMATFSRIRLLWSWFKIRGVTTQSELLTGSQFSVIETKDNEQQGSSIYLVSEMFLGFFCENLIVRLMLWLLSKILTIGYVQIQLWQWWNVNKTHSYLIVGYTVQTIFYWDHLDIITSNNHNRPL